MATAFNFEVVALTLHRNQSLLLTSQLLVCLCWTFMLLCLLSEANWSIYIQPQCPCLSSSCQSGHSQEVGPGKTELKLVHQLVIPYHQGPVLAAAQGEAQIFGEHRNRAAPGPQAGQEHSVKMEWCRRDCCVWKPSLHPMFSSRPGLGGEFCPNTLSCEPVMGCTHIPGSCSHQALPKSWTTHPLVSTRGFPPHSKGRTNP